MAHIFSSYSDYMLALCYRREPYLTLYQRGQMCDAYARTSPQLRTTLKYIRSKR